MTGGRSTSPPWPVPWDDGLGEALVAWATFGAGAVLTRLRSGDMRIILGSITASAKLYRVPSWLVVVVVFGLCPPLLGGWFAQSSGELGSVGAFRLDNYCNRPPSRLASLLSIWRPRIGKVARGRRAKAGDDQVARGRSDGQGELGAFRVWNDRFGLGQIPRVVELQMACCCGLGSPFAISIEISALS